MSKPGFKEPFILLLVTAFLALQWSASHIHLSQQHDHGEGQHEHMLEMHADHLASHHLDAIDIATADVSPHTGDSAVLDLDYDCTCSYAEQLVQPTLVVSVYFQFNHQSVAVHFLAPETTDSPHGFLERSALWLRGPPQLV